MTSHGPSRESNRPSRKSSGAAKAISPPTACTDLCTQRLREALPPAQGEPALLQRGMPEGGAEMVEMEGAAEISDDEVRQSEADRSKPALPRARQEPQTNGARGG